MRAPSRTANAAGAVAASCARSAALAIALVMVAGCAAGRSKSGVIARGGEGTGSWKPRSVGLLFPQLAPDSMPDRKAVGGDRVFMGSEINAVVHAALRKALEATASGEVRDLSVQAPARERMALLATVILREYWLNGTIPSRPVGELGRVSQCDAVLVVSVIKFGPSLHPLMVKNLGGDIRPDTSRGTVADRWMNCGVKLALVKVASAMPVWEAAYLESRPDEGNTQEMVAAACVEKLLDEYPYKK